MAAPLHTTGATTVPSGGRRTAGDQARANRAVKLVQLGELSAAASALTAEPLAPGIARHGRDFGSATFRDPDRRPQELQVPLSNAVLFFPHTFLTRGKFAMRVPVPTRPTLQRPAQLV